MTAPSHEDAACALARRRRFRLFGEAIERFERLAKRGRIHAHNEYISLTGAVGGFMLIQGDADELQKILLEPEFGALGDA